MRAQHSHRIQQTGAARQQCCHVIGGSQLVVHSDAQNTKAGHALNARQWRWQRPLLKRREYDLLSLFSLQPQVVASRPRLQVRDLVLTRVRSTTRHNQICIVRELKDSITAVDRMQVSGSDDV